MTEKIPNANWSSANYINHLKKKAINHKNYKIYSYGSRITCIAEEKALYLSDGHLWNDLVDKNNFCSDGKKRFARCFSFSKSENIAMWMLYGGNGGNGLMIDLNKTIMKDIVIHCTNVKLGYWDKNSGAFCIKQELHKGEFSLYLIDILYYALNENGEKYDLKRSNSSYDLGEPETINRLKYCRKSYPWSYENECRLILEPKIAIRDNKITDAKIEFEDILTKCFKKKISLENRIVASPNYVGVHKFKESALQGQIDWDLCFGCKHKPNQNNNKQQISKEVK